jgi:hypothetical protein
MKRVLEADVVVVGGGPAGINAAIASGRQGARTLLIERHGFLGGMSTAALVYPWMTFHTDKGVQVIQGIAQEIIDRLVELGGSPGHQRDTMGFVYSVTPYSPEIYKVLAIDMLKEANVKLLVHSFVDKVNATENGRITSVTLSGKSGPIEVIGSVFVDASGDADIAYLSGASTVRGRDGDRLTQPMTMKFRMRGVDLQKVKDSILARPNNFYEKTLVDQLPHLPLTGVSGFYEEWNAAGLPINRDLVLFFAGPAEDEVLINCTRVQGLDGTDVEDLTLAEEEGRRQVLMLEKFFRSSVPGFERATISSVGTQIGIRETRRIVGLYSLTMEDVLEGKRFSDTIARSGYPIDIHDPSGKGLTFGWIEGDGAYDIPYRSLVPKDCFNLLAAGRCISTTHEALATTRLTPSCMATGQAAGTAAAMACAEGVSPHDIDIRRLQKELLKSNMILT